MTTHGGAPTVPGHFAPRALLERERELAALTAAAEAACAGAAGLAIVEGPAGIGKSRLLAALREQGPDGGLRVLGARGSELELEFPFGVVRQLFEPALADPGVRERWLAGAAAPAAAVFSPPIEDGGADRDASFATLHGLFWLTAQAAADGPLLLAVDDLHWADGPSLRFVGYLARRLEGLPVLLVTGLRTGEPGADPALLADIVQQPTALIVRPAPLSDGAAGELVAARLGQEPDPAFRTACHEATGGNPLLLEQLLRSLGDDAVPPDAANAGLVHDIGPSAIGRTVLLRLARLPAEAVPVAQAVAVLGESAELPAVAALSEVDEDATAAAIGALARAEILRPERPLDFVHPLVREAVYRDMTVGRREVLHAAAARMLDGAGAPPERMAAHLMLVSPRRDQRTVATLRAAAAAATARGAPESATALLRRAVAEPPADEIRPQVLLELGLVESNVDVVAGAARLREAHDALADPLDRLGASAPLAWALIFTGEPDEAARLAREAADEAPPELDDLRRWLTAIELACIVFGAQVPDALERLAAERHEPVRDGPGAHALQCLVSYDWCLRGGSAREAGDLAVAALDDGALLAEPDGFMLGVGAMLTLEMGERPEAAAAWDAALAAAHRNGSLFAISAILMWRGLGLLRRGDVREAGRHLEESHAMMERWNIASQSYVLGFLTEQRIAAGSLAEARAFLPPVAGWGKLSDGVLIALRAHAELLLAEGRPADALTAAERLAEVLEGRGTRETMNPAWFAWRSLTARALDGLGRAEEALALLEDELERARVWGAPGPIGRALRLMGEIARDDGLGRLEEAVRVLEGSTARLEHALALTALGSALRRARRPTDAREPLRRALELAEACGAEGLVEHARSELYATGARPRATALSGAGALTPSERRVAAMAAEGLSNRDIAESLYVTPKTVELHLSSAYRKLGVRSRRDLPGALATP
jgi:DNA-binding CsgD family transcriptional regulator